MWVRRSDFLTFYKKYLPPHLPPTYYILGPVVPPGLDVGNLYTVRDILYMLRAGLGERSEDRYHSLL